MKSKVYSLSIVLAVAAAGICPAASNSELARENAELRQRVERLEKQQQEHGNGNGHNQAARIAQNVQKLLPRYRDHPAGGKMLHDCTPVKGASILSRA